MSAARKTSRPATPLPNPVAAAPTLSAASSNSQAGLNPVLDQHVRLTAAFASPASVDGYPGAVKIAILFGAPLAMWAGLFGVGSWIAHRL